MKCGRAIDVWLVDDEVADARLQAEYRQLLSPEERAQELRFYFPRDQRRYLVTRALVRTVLSRYLLIEPADLRFEKDHYGRPGIVNGGREHRGLCFNISHTQGLIAVGVTWHRELGVDVEHVRARPVSLEIAGRFFAGSEAAALAMTPADRQQERFFEYWTFKESYVKARGAGLSIPLEQFSFQYPNEHAVRITIQPQLRDHADRWHFWQLRPTRDHLLAICAERRHTTAPTLTIRRTIPLVGDEVVPARVFKTSEAGCAA